MENNKYSNQNENIQKNLKELDKQIKENESKLNELKNYKQNILKDIYKLWNIYLL